MIMITTMNVHLFLHISHAVLELHWDLFIWFIVTRAWL